MKNTYEFLLHWNVIFYKQLYQATKVIQGLERSLKVGLEMLGIFASDNMPRLGQDFKGIQSNLLTAQEGVLCHVDFKLSFFCRLCMIRIIDLCMRYNIFFFMLKFHVFLADTVGEVEPQ